MLDFDPTTHTYRQDGRVIPGVTDTIRPLAPDFERFAPESARQRGQWVHALCAVMDGRDDLWPTDMPDGMEEELAGYCDAWRRFKVESEVAILPEFIERQVHNELYQYAGTIDRLVVWNDLRVVVDIKTGAYHPSHRLQLAAYRDALHAQSSRRVHHGAAVYLKPDGKYTVKTFDRLAGAFTTFLALRSIAEWEKEHGAFQPEVADTWVPLKPDEIFEL